MDLKRISLFLVLVVCGAFGQDIFGDDDPYEYGTTTGPSCIVRGEKGTCVESRLYCSTKHTGASSVTFRSAVRGCANNYICCKDSDVIPNGNILPTTTTTTSTPDTLAVGCGIRRDNNFWRANTRVKQARFGEFPWTIAVYKIDDNGAESYIGVGSLIHPRVVLTVANRFDRGGRFKIRAGDWNLAERRERLPHQEREVESTVIHEQFNTGSGAYDVGLLFLVSDVKPARHINYACLPNSNVATPPSTQCLASGWGREREDQPLQETQKFIELPVVDRGSCQTRVRAGLENEDYNLDASMMCAGGNGQDACYGDGGAPLVCPYRGQTQRYYQAGIVSWGIECQQQGLPGVYTDVAHVRDWIDQQVIAKGFTTNYYTP